MKVYGQLEKAQIENVLSSDIQTLALAASPGRIVYDKDHHTLYYYNGSSWLPLAISSGLGTGAGSPLTWSTEGDNAAVVATENRLTVFKFSPSIAQTIKTTFMVPSAYVKGSPITAKLAIYSPGVTGTDFITSTSTLIRNNGVVADPITSTTNQRPATNMALTVPAIANTLQQVSLDLTDSTGNINAIPVSPGDFITILVTRGADTDTQDIRVIPSAVEVKFS